MTSRTHNDLCSADSRFCRIANHVDQHLFDIDATDSRRESLKQDIDLERSGSLDDIGTRQFRGTANDVIQIFDPFCCRLDARRCCHLPLLNSTP